MGLVMIDLDGDGEIRAEQLHNKTKVIPFDG